MKSSFEKKRKVVLAFITLCFCLVIFGWIAMGFAFYKLPDTELYKAIIHYFTKRG